MLVQGTLDLGNLIGTPWQLHAAWPGSQLHLVDNAGHDAGTSTIADILTAAVNDFAEGNAGPE